MADIFKLHKCQTFVLLEMHYMDNVWFANKKFSLSTGLVYHKRAVENVIF